MFCFFRALLCFRALISIELLVQFYRLLYGFRLPLAWGSEMKLSTSSASGGGCGKCMRMSPEVLRLLVSGANEEPSLSSASSERGGGGGRRLVLPSVS